MTAPAPAPAPARSRRGRETVLDMLRTLGLVFIVVVPIWFFYRATPADSKYIRPIDASETFKDFTSETGGPVPSSTPPGWITNVQAYDGDVARVGYVIKKHYLEFQGSAGTDWLYDATDKGKQVGTVEVAGATWQRWDSGSGKTSLVRSFGKATVLVGGVRENASLAELEQLAALIP